MSVFNGTPPRIASYQGEKAEIEAVAKWLRDGIHQDKIHPHEMGTFVRSDKELHRAKAAADEWGSCQEF